MSNTAEQLVEVVNEWHARLSAIDSTRAHHRPSADRWTIQEVIGHLVDSASNNHQRFVRAQLAESLTSPAYAQNEWVKSQQYDAYDWQNLLTLWRHYNLFLAHVMRQIPADQMESICHIGDHEPVTLEFLIDDYLAHMQHHLQKIEERLAQ